MKHISLILILWAVGAGTATFGQSSSFFALSYNTALPFGEVKEYTDATSWRGVSMEWRWFKQDLISAGLYFGWNVFHQKISDDFIFEERAVSGTQLRTINAFPILVTGHYYLANEIEFRPYLGIGVGTYHTKQRTTIGIFQFDENNWQFGFTPSIGATFPLRSNLMGNLEVKYNYALKAGDSLTYSYLGINLGLAWSRW